MGYKVLDGDWSDAGTFESLLRAGMIVKKHKEKKEGTADEHRSHYNNIINIFRPEPATSKNASRTISKQISKQNIKDRPKIDPQQPPIHSVDKFISIIPQ